jgi:hypothetical protein
LNCKNTYFRRSNIDSCHIVFLRQLQSILGIV